MVVEQKPRERHQPTQSTPTTVRSLRPTTTAPASRLSKRQARLESWQRKQELIRRERLLGALFGVACLAGTLVMLYVAGHATATGEGYELAELKRQIKDEEVESVRLQSEIRRLEDSNAINKEVGEHQLVLTPKGIHYLGEKH